MLRRHLLIALALYAAPVQADLWDSITQVFGPSSQEDDQQSSLSNNDKMQILNAALSSNTLSPQLEMALLVERGDIYLDQGQYQQALNDFNTVLARKPADKEILLEALAGQAKALLALDRMDQYLATRTLIINMAPVEGYPVDSDYYYLVTFPDLWGGGANWWRNPQWRGSYHQWLHNHHPHSNHVNFTKNSVNVVQKPRFETTPSRQPVPAKPTEPQSRQGEEKNFEYKMPNGRERDIQRPSDRNERPQGRPPTPAARPSLPDRSDARPGPLNR